MADITYDADNARREYFRALVKAQKAAAHGPATRGEFDADGRNTGKSFGFKYATPRDTTEWARAVLNAEGIALTVAGDGELVLDGGAWKMRIPFAAVHVMGHVQPMAAYIPVTPLRGNLVSGWGGVQTSAIKATLFNLLCVRVDDKDPMLHADADPAPAATGLPEPIGFPDAAPEEQRPAPAPAPQPPPVAAAPAPQAPPVPDPRCAAALSALVAACKEHGSHMKDALIGVNEALQKAGRPALIESPGCGLARPVEVADVATLDHYRYELDAALAAGPGGELPNDGGAASATPSAPAPTPAPSPSPSAPAATQPTPPAPAAPPPAPRAATPAATAGASAPEPSAADDAGVKARWDTLFGRLRGARAKRGQSDAKFTDGILAAINGAAGHEVLSKTAKLDLAVVTASRVARIESWLALYEGGR